MKELKDVIIQEGLPINKDVLVADSFLNHEVDAWLMKNIGQEFYSRFRKEPITKIVTLESSGIAPALMCALYFNVPVVFAKEEPHAISSDYYKETVYSFTQEELVDIIICINRLEKSDYVLIIDDFLANGDAALGLVNLIKQAGATIAGLGIVIEKSFQSGREKLLAEGIRLESLARIASMKQGKVEFIEEKLVR